MVRLKTDEAGNIVGGHQRYKVLLAEGVTEIDLSLIHIWEADLLTKLHSEPQIHLRGMQGGGFDSKSRKRTA